MSLSFNETTTSFPSSEISSALFITFFCCFMLMSLVVTWLNIEVIFQLIAVESCGGVETNCVTFFFFLTYSQLLSIIQSSRHSNWDRVKVFVEFSSINRKSIRNLLRPLKIYSSDDFSNSFHVRLRISFHIATFFGGSRE